MTSTDFHLRHLISQAAEQKSLRLIDDAFTIIQGNFERFTGDFSPELLVLFAEVASDLRERSSEVVRALDLYDRLQCEDDQFKVRALLVRCVYEARLGSEQCKLKGVHSLQQLKYALDFLTKALAITSRPGNDARYGFLVYNASLVFWDIVRPMCRTGWQKHIVQETTTILDALKSIAKAPSAAGGKPPAGGGGAANAVIPVNVELSAWLIELSLSLAFAFEDADRNPDAQKLDYPFSLMEDAQDPKLQRLALSAKAWFARKAPGKTKEDIDKLSGSAVFGTALFVCYTPGLPKEQAEEQLIAAWKLVDSEYDLREAKDAFMAKGPIEDKGEKVKSLLKPPQLVELSLVLRAACVAECWQLAQPMLARLEKFQTPAGRGKLTLDLSKAEIEVWQACNVTQEDPATKMKVVGEPQQKREVEARHKAVRLCEQCITTARRLDEIDLVEESAVVMWNLGRELACAGHRFRIHKSFQKCAEVLQEIQSTSLVQLRVQLHYEVACCEVAQDLLTKGRTELYRAQALDYTIPQGELSEAIQKQLGDDDPGPHVRKFDAAIEQQLHLLYWKLNLYEEPQDPADQVMLLLDQVQKQGSSSGKLTFNLLAQGFAKLDAALEEVTGEALQSRSDTFTPPPRVISSTSSLQPLEHQAPATVKEGGARADEIVALVPQPIRDQKPKSDREKGVAKAKRIIMLMCKIALEAQKVGEAEFAIRVCTRAMEVKDVSFGPPPIEVEGALLLAEAAYTKAQCLAEQLEALEVINGIDDEQEETEQPPDDPDEEVRQLKPEEKSAACAMKRDLTKALLYGMEKSHEFGQGWMLANGLVHWWNLHLDLVSTAHEQPQILSRTLVEYQDGLKQLQRYLVGDAKLQASDLNHDIAANLALAYMDVNFEMGQLGVLETDQLMVMKRLGEHERKRIAARVTELCKRKDKPVPDMTKLRPERLDGAAPAAGGGGKKGAPAAAAPVSEDKSDLQGNEADIMAAMTGIPFAKDSAEAVKLVDQAVTLLNRWEPRQNDESMLTLWVELWTRLGRHCLGKPMHANEGAKYALMCGIKGLGKVDAAREEGEAIPKFASQDRLRWRGACHALCGEVFMVLVDPEKQEKESLVKLRRMSVQQFERCCEYANLTGNSALAVAGATSLWNVSLPLMHSAETRQLLIKPLAHATRALAAVKFQDDPRFFVGLYRARFDCLSDTSQWDKIHEMLNEAFQIIPASDQRRLWALRMLALSRQGKNVVVAMGKMKESQAKAQAGIWLVLAHASSRQSDQVNAYAKAIEILQTAKQPEVVEVRMQFADWLLRSGYDTADAEEQLAAAADILLEIEEDSEEEENEVDAVEEFYRVGPDDDDHSASDWDQSQSDGRSMTSRNSITDLGASRKRTRTGPDRKSGSKGGRSRASSICSSVGGRKSTTKSQRSNSSRRCSTARSMKSSKSSRQKREEEDEELSQHLYSHHYEVLTRIYATQSRLTTGLSVHSALLEASHFAVKFFSRTVELANDALHKLAAAAKLAEEVPAADASKPGSAKAAAKPGTAGGRQRLLSIPDGKRPNLQEMAPVRLKPGFVVPAHMADWAHEDHWPWGAGAGSHLADVFSRAAELELLDGESCTWAGHPDVFARPPLAFHTLVRLVDDLEEHGLHLWAFPVLALQVQLSLAFQPPLSDAIASPSSRRLTCISDAIACLARLRLSRLASQCRLGAAAAAAAAKCAPVLEKLNETFSLFDDDREQVRSQRAGQGSAETLDPDWAPPQKGQISADRRVCSPWHCGELRAYEIWAVLSKECMLHGELWIAATLADEAAKHARDYGDRRTLRDLCITQARLATIEGKSFDVVEHLKDLEAADAQQAVEVAALLASTYRRKRQVAPADAVLRATGSALEAAFRGQPSDSRQIQAQCALRTEQLHAEIARLRAAPVASREWLADLQGAFSTHESIGAQLEQGALHRRRVSDCLAFAEAIAALLEAKQQQIARDPASAGVLTLGHLAQAASDLAEATAACRPSRDTLLALALPSEGLSDGAVLPAEVAAARLDTWDARCKAFQRALQSAADRECARVDAGSAGAAVFSTAHGDGGSRSLAAVKDLDKATALAQSVDAWLGDVDAEISGADRQKQVARAIAEVEESVALVSNAATAMQLAGPLDPPDDDDGAKDQNTRMPSCRVEALVELGRLQLELAARESPEAFASKWRAPACDPYELRGMSVGELYSNVLMNKSPYQLFEYAPEPEEVPLHGADMLEEVAKNTLCEALKGAIAARQFGQAKRALEALAIDAYGLTCPEATFEFLVWRQSIEVCLQAEEALQELLPEDHHESVQMQLLQQLERDWPYPQESVCYQSTLSRLQLESPSFQRFQLQDLPPISELLLTSVPALTLVITLQVHNHYLYVGAVCTPPDGDPSQRATQLRHMVSRIEVREAELHRCMQKLQEINTAIEKEMPTTAEINAALADQYASFIAQAEAALIAPILKDLVTHFWPFGMYADHPGAPRQIMLLLDSFLWGLPFERFSSLTQLLGNSPGVSLFSRDLSLHALAQRSRTPAPTVRPASSVLLTDAFNEDALGPQDDAKSETMCTVHKRLVETKVISNDSKSLHGQMLTASPEDIKGMLSDATMFMALGFGRFFTSISATHFASQDLRHLKLLALFHGAQNDQAFRRQTKTDSMKSIRQLALESSYGLSLLATFRGVHCLVAAIAPVPAPLGMRCFETFSKAVQGGKSGAKAIEEVMDLKIDDPSKRYTRTLEGPPVDPKKGAPPPRPESQEGREDLLLPHTRTAYVVVGAAWATSDLAEAPAKGKK